MKTDEIFANRRVVARKICRIVGENGGQLVNAKYFLERPYCASVKTYKFSTANYTRLLASNNKVIQECDPRWFSIDEIKSQEGYLQEFYNARDILEKDSFAPENQDLETIIENLQARGIIEQLADIISFQDCIDAVKQYAEDKGADELTY